MSEKQGRWLQYDAATVTEFHKRRRTNRTGFLGVKQAKWGFDAFIRVHGRKEKLYAGHAKTAEAAAHLYDKKAVELYGDEAVTNFPLAKGAV